MKAAEVEAGVFKPAPPTDSGEVLSLFAIAARAACVRPEGLEEISKTLAAAIANLVPPEKLAAEECVRLWALFVRMVRRPKPQLRVEAGRALFRDLEAIGQRLDLPPLSNWDEIPAGVNAPNAVNVKRAFDDDEGTSIEQVKSRAKAKAKKKGSGPPLKGQEVLGLLVELSSDTRERLYTQMIGAGALGRSDAALIERVLASGAKVGREDDVLIEALEKLGTWLVK
jgi:hypothetical protein